MSDAVEINVDNPEATLRGFFTDNECAVLLDGLMAASAYASFWTEDRLGHLSAPARERTVGERDRSIERAQAFRRLLAKTGHVNFTCGDGMPWVGNQQLEYPALQYLGAPKA